MNKHRSRIEIQQFREFIDEGNTMADTLKYINFERRDYISPIEDNIKKKLERCYNEDVDGFPKTSMQ